MSADRIFKGATRPALLGGVPLVALVLVQGSLFLVALWLFLLVSGFAALVAAALGLVAYFVMRVQTRQDDQRLRQIGLRLRFRGWSSLTRGNAHWASTTSRPLACRRR